jgi:NADH-quinone oxidoreductase subunit G
VQGFHGVVRPLGETRPGWKVLRVLGNLLGLEGFDFETSQDVLSAALGTAEVASRLDNSAASGASASQRAGSAALERLADVPIYATDALVRRAPALQATADARAPQVGVPTALWQQLGLQAGSRVRVTQGDAQAVLPARHEPTLAPGVLRVAAGHPDSAGLGPMFGAIRIEAV